MGADLAMIASMFKANSQLFRKATQGVPPERWLAQPSEDSNHLLWIAGHLVVHRAKVPKLLGGEWSAPWQVLFARGTRPVTPEQYPGVDEIERAWAEVSEKLSTSLAGATAEVLAKPAPQKSPSFDGSVGGQIAFLCYHEAYHLGQMGFLRKWLGYGQLVG